MTKIQFLETGETRTTLATTPSLEEAPLKNIFHIEVIGGESSQRVRDCFLISRGASGASMSCNKLDPKSTSREKIG
jgi:hypothetical protein